MWWTGTDTGALMTYKEVPLGAAPAEHPTRSSFPMIKLQGEQARWLLGIAGQPRGPAQQETLLSVMRAVGWMLPSLNYRFGLFDQCPMTFSGCQTTVGLSYNVDRAGETRSAQRVAEWGRLCCHYAEPTRNDTS